MSITRDAANLASEVIERAGSIAGEAVEGAGRAAGAIVDGAGRVADEASDLASTAGRRTGPARVVVPLLALIGAIVVWRRLRGDEQQRPSSEMDRFRAA